VTGPLAFAFMGLLGALLYILMWSRKAEDLTQYDSIRHLIIGLIVGYIYSILHTDYNFPNGIMALVAGYMGPDFVQAVIEKLKQAAEEKLQ
jgi:uncharacterized membrane protein YeaQ/YmgE (transglycosylase-associated protein family)